MRTSLALDVQFASCCVRASCERKAKLTATIEPSKRKIDRARADSVRRSANMI